MTKSAVKEREPALDLQVESAPQNKPPAVRGKAKVAEPASSATISTALVAAASNPQVDAAKMKALWDLHKEIKAEEARVAFLHDFHAMSRKMPIIDKNGRIVIEAKPGKRGQSTSYPKYDEVHEVLKPLLDEFNFIMDHATEPNEAGDRNQRRKLSPPYRRARNAHGVSPPGGDVRQQKQRAGMGLV